jgi:hypothetical protein
MTGTLIPTALAPLMSIPEPWKEGNTSGTGPNTATDVYSGTDGVAYVVINLMCQSQSSCPD